jgi:hypothetical protein
MIRQMTNWLSALPPERDCEDYSYKYVWNQALEMKFTN